MNQLTALFRLENNRNCFLECFFRYFTINGLRSLTLFQSKLTWAVSNYKINSRLRTINFCGWKLPTNLQVPVQIRSVLKTFAAFPSEGLFSRLRNRYFLFCVCYPPISTRFSTLTVQPPTWLCFSYFMILFSPVGISVGMEA